MFSKKKKLPKKTINSNNFKYYSTVNNSAASFRRNQTLNSGGTKGDKNEYSQRLKRHEKRHLLRKVAIVLVFLFLIGSAGLYVCYNKISQSEIVVDNLSNIKKTINSNNYLTSINKYLANNFFENFSFWLNKNDLTAYLQKQYPEIKTVESVNMAGYEKATFDLKFRQPIAKWTINSTNYYIDESGVLFLRNYFSDPSVDIVDKNDIQTNTLNSTMSASLLSFIGKTIKATKQFGYSINQVVLPLNTSRQIAFTVNGSNTQVIFSLDRSIGEQAEDMANAFSYFGKKNKNPSYIDLRVKGEAFYK